MKTLIVIAFMMISLAGYSQVAPGHCAILFNRGERIDRVIDSLHYENGQYIHYTNLPNVRLVYTGGLSYQFADIYDGMLEIISKSKPVYKPTYRNGNFKGWFMTGDTAQGVFTRDYYRATDGKYYQIRIK